MQTHSLLRIASEVFNNKSVKVTFFFTEHVHVSAIIQEKGHIYVPVIFIFVVTYTQYVFHSQ